MLYKLRNNASVSFDKDTNRSVFVCFRFGTLQDAPGYAEALLHKAQELSVIVEKITGKKQDNNGVTVIIEDTLKILEQNGFVISGNTEEELFKKEIPLYRNIIAK
ncbi:MAG: hypothetical protein FWF38_01815 [Spirochaetaceae bacterium]|nr:hypothetical protein [Spirochaetaceae bacterium]